MLEHLRALGIDADYLRRSRDVSRDLAVAYRHHSGEAADRDMWLLAAATDYRRAAADSLLLDEVAVAKGLFDAATNAYAACNSPYAGLMSLLGTGDTPDTGFRSADTIRPEDVFALWGVQARRWQIGGSIEALQAYRSEPVGLLGLPVGAYLDLLQTVTPPDTAGQPAVAEALFPFVAAYGLGLKNTMRDRFHWSRLAMPFHPIEPDVLAVLVAVDNQMHGRDGQVQGILRSLPIGHLAVSCLSDSLRLYRDQ